MTGRRYTGRCQCGAIRYRINGEPLLLYACHCRDCQKQSSSAFGMSLWVAREDFELLAGEPRIWETRGDSGALKRCAFCATCGSRIYHAGEDPGEPLSVKAGSLDDVSALRPIGHLWSRRAQPWLDLHPESFECADEEAVDFDDWQRRWQATRSA
ncbi:MAG: GFA family protein [Gammaproteobacteria bacterium]|nr:GFA family protein [Gammaproteobacteria bacterium]